MHRYFDHFVDCIFDCLTHSFIDSLPAADENASHIKEKTPIDKAIAKKVAMSGSQQHVHNTTVHGYAQVHTSIYIYIYTFGQSEGGGTPNGVMKLPRRVMAGRAELAGGFS